MLVRLKLNLKADFGTGWSTWAKTTNASNRSCAKLGFNLKASKWLQGSQGNVKSFSLTSTRAEASRPCVKGWKGAGRAAAGKGGFFSKKRLKVAHLKIMQDPLRHEGWKASSKAQPEDGTRARGWAATHSARPSLVGASQKVFVHAKLQRAPCSKVEGPLVSVVWHEELQEVYKEHLKEERRPSDGG